MQVHDYHAVVLGTGCAGLTAAVRAAVACARIGIFEKSSHVGGTTAWSGGTGSLPNNVDGGVIPGLCAAGSAVGSIFGMTDGGHGGTIGPGLVLGYLSGASDAKRAFAAGCAGEAS